MDTSFCLGFVFFSISFWSVAWSEPYFLDIDNDNVVDVAEGEDAVLFCEIGNMTDAYQVTWSNPSGEQITNGTSVLTTDTRFSLRQSWNLRIENVSDTDGGIYKCEISTVPPKHKTVELLLLFEQPTSDPVTLVEDEPSATESTTEDPNSCSGSRPCENGGFCNMSVCSCTNDFTGVFCEVPAVCPLGFCNINNTRNCSVVMKGVQPTYRCDCLLLYKGLQCEIYDYCELYPCRNMGYCKLLYPQDGYMCRCRTGDPENDCKLNDHIDNCALKPPLGQDSYITCLDKIDSYKMYCSPGYAGEREGCRNSQDPQLFCNQKGEGYCTDEGYCKPLCNVDICNGTRNCEFTANPYNTSGFLLKPSCVRDFGNGYDNQDCHGEETLFDGFDYKINHLSDCSPFIDTICTRDFGNGDCKPECNNEDCLFDGFDCPARNRTELAGVVIVELKNRLQASPNRTVVQKSISLMLRSGVNLTEGEYLYEPAPLLQLKVTNTVFTDIDYAGKFLAAAVAKRPEWLEGVQVTDIYVCPAGKYSDMYSDKCRSNCSNNCIQSGDICDWKTGVCLYGCQPAHWGEFCTPCDTCVQNGDVCEYFTGNCLFGCQPGHYGNRCLPCSTCKKEGDICNNDTGVCLHGCISKNFYGPMCIQCPQNCVGGCNESGFCNSCAHGWHGEMCNKECDEYCQNDTCDMRTGVCVCQLGSYWNENWCEFCSSGCTNSCDVISGVCNCRDGYHGSKCVLHCEHTCTNGTCYVNGTCDVGCDEGFYGPVCKKTCPAGCNDCSRDSGICYGNCKPGFDGSNCEKKAGQRYVDAVTDNTGVIIGVVISLLLVLLILVVACCYWRKRRSGDYVMEDEEMEEPMAKNANTVQVHTNKHMQPSTPLLGHSMDIIELDEKQNTVVYAGPGRGDAADDTPDDNEPEEKAAEDGAPGDDTAEPADGKNDEIPNDANKPEGRKERCTSSVTMEIGVGGRVLSVSDTDEVQSPTLKKEAELPIGEEEVGTDDAADDSAFAEPPHSPLGEVRAPLASEENILASLGPKEIQFDRTDEPEELGQEKGDKSEEEEKGSQRSRSSSSSSSRSNSSKGSKEEITTEM